MSEEQGQVSTRLEDEAAVGKPKTPQEALAESCRCETCLWWGPEYGKLSRAHLCHGSPMTIWKDPEDWCAVHWLKVV